MLDHARDESMIETSPPPGAASAGAVMILDVLSLTPLEDVAASVPPGTELWMQTYLFADRELVTQVVRRAERACFKALVVTLDEPYFYDIRCNAIEAFQLKYERNL